MIETATETEARGFPPVFRRMAWALALMMAASIAYTLAMTALLRPVMPYGFTYFLKELLWLDLHTFQAQSQHFRMANYWDDWGYPMTYPALVAVIMGFLYKLPRPIHIYILFLLCGFASWVLWLSRGLAQRGLDRGQAIAFGLIVLFTSWPVFLQLDCGNIEGMMAIVLGLGVLAVLKNKTWLGAALIAIAVAMKMFPFILLGLLFSKRRYKEFAFACVLAWLLNLGSLAILGPSVSEAQRHITDGIRFVQEVFMIPVTPVALGFSHALFSPIKFGVALGYRMLHPVRSHARMLDELHIMTRALKVYLVFAAVAGTALYFGRIRKLPALNQLFALVVCAVGLTPFSSDYTLCHLLVPFGLLCFYVLDRASEGRTVPGATTCFACLCFCWGYMSFFTIHYVFATPMRTLALIVLLVTVLRNPWPWPRLDDQPQLDGKPQDAIPA